MSKEKFSLGDMVFWETKARGVLKTITGQIVFILHDTNPFSPRVIAKHAFPRHRRMFVGDCIPGGKDQTVGYLVEVIGPKGVKPKLYLPLPQKINRVADDFIKRIEA